MEIAARCRQFWPARICLVNGGSRRRLSMANQACSQDQRKVPRRQSRTVEGRGSPSRGRNRASARAGMGSWELEESFGKWDAIRELQIDAEWEWGAGPLKCCRR
jgi:hypothetical protein